MKSLNFGFVHLDNFIWLFQLPDKKRKEKTRQGKKQNRLIALTNKKLIRLEINVDIIMIERPAGNTRLWSQAG